MVNKQTEEREKKALKHISENGKATLNDICILIRRSKNTTRALLSKYVHNKTIFMRKLSGTNEIYSSTPFEELPKEEPKVEASMLKDLVLPEKSTEPQDDKYVRIEGIGTISEKKLSELFSEGILTVDIDKILKKINTGNVAFEKDKLVFEV